MKNKYWIIPSVLLLVVGSIAIIGCTTSQQKATYNTLYSLESAVTASVDAYDAQIISGSISTNSLPTVTKAFNDFQAAMNVAVTLNQNNSNAVAPPDLAVEAASVINLITNIVNTVK